LEERLATQIETESGQFVDISEDLEQVKTHLEHLMFNAGQVFELRSRETHSPLAKSYSKTRHCRPLPTPHKRVARILAPAHRKTST
jgi:hypothetical protein